jgi:hypothetical protein
MSAFPPTAGGAIKRSARHARIGYKEYMHRSVEYNNRSTKADRSTPHRAYQKPAAMLSREQIRRIVAEMIG